MSKKSRFVADEDDFSSTPYPELEELEEEDEEEDTDTDEDTDEDE